MLNGAFGTWTTWGTNQVLVLGELLVCTGNTETAPRVWPWRDGGQNHLWKEGIRQEGKDGGTERRRDLE